MDALHNNQAASESTPPARSRRAFLKTLGGLCAAGLAAGLTGCELEYDDFDYDHHRRRRHDRHDRDDHRDRDDHHDRDDDHHDRHDRYRRYDPHY